MRTCCSAVVLWILAWGWGFGESRVVGYWPLEEDGRNEIFESDHGVLMGDARFEGGALKVGGAGCVDFGGVGGLGGGGSFSVAVWVKAERGDGLMRVAGKYGQSEDQREWCVFLCDSNRVWFFVSGDGKAGEKSVLKATERGVIRVGEWQHLAVAWEAGGETRIYVDGEEKRTVDGGVERLDERFEGKASVTVGSYDIGLDGVVSNGFVGEMKGFGVFDGALSADEVEEVGMWGLGGEEKRPGRGEGGKFVLECGRRRSEKVPAGGKPGGGVEGRGRNQGNGIVRGRVIYVDARVGDDRYSGLSAVVGPGLDGPKRTIRAGLEAVERGGTVIVGDGEYAERVVVDGARVLIPGRAVIHPGQ